MEEGQGGVWAKRSSALRDTLYRAWGRRLEDIDKACIAGIYMFGANIIVDMLYNQDATLQFISRKEWESFVKD